jgi:hypothetical protein
LGRDSIAVVHGSEGVASPVKLWLLVNCRHDGQRYLLLVFDGVVGWWGGALCWFVILLGKPEAGGSLYG